MKTLYLCSLRLYRLTRYVRRELRVIQQAKAIVKSRVQYRFELKKSMEDMEWLKQVANTIITGCLAGRLSCSTVVISIDPSLATAAGISGAFKARVHTLKDLLADLEDAMNKPIPKSEEEEVQPGRPANAAVNNIIPQQPTRSVILNHDGVYYNRGVASQSVSHELVYSGVSVGSAAQVQTLLQYLHA